MASTSMTTWQFAPAIGVRWPVAAHISIGLPAISLTALRCVTSGGQHQMFFMNALKFELRRYTLGSQYLIPKWIIVTFLDGDKPAMPDTDKTL